MTLNSESSGNICKSGNAFLFHLGIACLYPNRIACIQCIKEWVSWEEAPISGSRALAWHCSRPDTQYVWSRNTNEGTHLQCNTDIIPNKREYMENRGRIWVSRAYWAISRNDLQIFFVEGATISSAVEDSNKESTWKNLFWSVFASRNWKVVVDKHILPALNRSKSDTVRMVGNW